MRVTNNMIMNNASFNINGTKGGVNDRNTQMTTQKKINKPSDDPVVAIRSLRLSTTLSKVNQYYKRNIPDAQSWLDVTETALLNIKSLMTDARTLSVKGSTDTLTQTDRETILTQLEKLQQAMFAEGNADYAGRTVFTGYRTDRDLVFMSEDNITEYSITQEFTSDALETHRYYYGSVTVPDSPFRAKAELALKETDNTAYNQMDDAQIAETYTSEYYRVRLGYDKVKIADTDEDGTVSEDEIKATLKFSNNDINTKIADSTYKIHVYDNSSDPNWFQACVADSTDPVTVADDEIVFLKETGEIIFGANVANEIKTTNSKLRVDYYKAGFEEGELRPEYYYNCTYHDIPNDKDVEYTKFTTDLEGFNADEIQFDIEYTVAVNQTITVNTEASDVFNSDILRDITEMIATVKKSIAAHEKIDKIIVLQVEAQYDDKASQDALAAYKTAAQKEADFADNDLQKLFSTEIGKLDGYLAQVNLGITNLGCVTDSLALTEKRMSDQQETVQELQSQNDDIDLSQIIIEYTAAYTAYQASLTAAGKLGQQTLLNYI